MSVAQVLSQLGGCDGYRVLRWHQEHRAGERWLLVEMAPVEDLSRQTSTVPLTRNHPHRMRPLRDSSTAPARAVFSA